ncbi:MAG TPA: VOC family protein [Blastocatellia bacterium]|jgi:predicted enzyme related to lactoylglutathione lyase|nr:VOC family protein [Blastocatellia bacterium]
MVDLKLNFLGINVTDFQESYRFYNEVLGIRDTGIQPEWEGFAQLGMTWEEYFSAEAKGMIFELFNRKVQPLHDSTWGNGQGFRPSIQVQDLDATIAEMRGRGVTFTGEVERTSIGRRIEFMAPEGIRWSLAHAPSYPAGATLRRPHIGWVESKNEDLKAQQSFYTEVMRLEVRDCGDDHCILGQGPLEPLLILEPGGTAARSLPGWNVDSSLQQPVLISFMTYDVHGAAAWLKGHKVTIVRDVTHHPDWGGTDIYVADPEGNRVQVVQYAKS